MIAGMRPVWLVRNYRCPYDLASGDGGTFMKNRLVFAIGGMLAALLLVSCGGGSELTIEEYFEKLQQISDDRTALVDQNELEFDEVLENEDSDEDDIVKAFQEFFKGNTDAAKDSLSASEGLSPPAAVEAAHDGFVAKLKTFVDVLEDFRSELDDVDSQGELIALIEGSDAVELAGDEFEEACETVQQAATDNGATVDLDCGGDEDDS